MNNQSLESLGSALTLSNDRVEQTMPGAFAPYDEESRKSSEILIAPETGIISKSKKRAPIKALYEFLSLEAWHELLKGYSSVNVLKFKAPRPVGLFNGRDGEPGVYMEFVRGYRIGKLSNMKRTTPVRINGQNTAVPLYPACALHLGMLNAIKEKEELLHADYGARHVFFSHQPNTFMGVIDVENSVIACNLELLPQESQRIYNEFAKTVSSPRDSRAIREWYEEGRESMIVPDGVHRLEGVIESINKKYGINFDMRNGKINGTSVPLGSSSIRKMSDITSVRDERDVSL